MNDQHDHSRKLGIAEGCLMYIAALGEAPIHDTTPASVLIQRIREMTACARNALVLTNTEVKV